MTTFDMYMEELAEFGTIEQRRAYVAKKRAENPNWENTIFRRGKTARGEGWSKDSTAGLVTSYGAGSRHRKASASRPGMSRKARRH